MVDRYMREDYHHNDDSAWWKTGLTVLALTLFFVGGWMSNDLYESNVNQSAGEQEFGIGGAPLGPSVDSPMVVTPTPDDVYGLTGTEGMSDPTPTVTPQL